MSDGTVKKKYAHWKLKPHVKRQNAVRRDAVRRLRQARFIELQVKGVPTVDIAKAHNVGVQTVIKEAKIGVQNGVVEEVRERLEKQLDKIPNIYAEILNMNVDATVTEMSMKVRDLKLKAAKQLADGLGPFQKTSKNVSVKSTRDLNDFYRLRAARAGEVIDVTPQRVELSEGEVMELVPVEEPTDRDPDSSPEASDEQKSMGK